MTITYQNFLSDTIKYIRDFLSSNITDPITATRPSGERFVMTSYPQKKVTYPIITVVDGGISDAKRLGMSSEWTAIQLNIDIRVWAKDIAQRDKLAQEVYTDLRTNQLGTSNESTNNYLHDFKLENMRNITEDGDGPKSKIITISYLYIGNDS